MTVLEAIEQLTAERKEKRIEPLNIVFRSIYDKLSISWFEMVEELERLKKSRINPHRGYAERQIRKT